MKKILGICILIIGLLAMGFFSQASFFVLNAESGTLFYYDYIDGVSAVGINGVTDTTITDVRIPSTINGYPVTTIFKDNSSDFGHYGFLSDNYISVIELLDLKDADNLTMIEAGAFAGCVNLKGDLYLPNSMATIGRSAFSDTKISRVFVNSENISVSASSFPNNSVVVYSSYELMYKYHNDENRDVDWAEYESKYQYEITLNIDGEIKHTGISQIFGDAFENNYNQIMNYLAGYEVETIKQDGEDLSAELLSSGEEIVVVTKQSSTPAETSFNRLITYGETLSLSVEAVQNATYKWLWQGEYIENSTTQLQKDGLNAGEYIAKCETYVGGEKSNICTFNISVQKADYIVEYPSQNRFVCLEFYSELITKHFVLEDIIYEFYLNDSKVETFSVIGQYRVDVSLNEELSKNYEILNPSFEFYLVKKEVSISWPANTYGYTGQEIIPLFVISGDTLGYDLDLITSDDSVLSATMVGDYVINIEGLTNEYFTFSKDTVMTFSWHIAKTILTIQWDVNSFDYTSTAITPIAYGESDGVRIKLKVSELSTGNTSFVNVDTYNVVATLPEGYEGFTLQGQQTNTLTINPVRLEVVFVSNNEFTYNGQIQEVEAEITTQIQEDVEIVLSGHRYKDAGNYIARVEGVNNSNYYVDDDITFEWKINPKLLIVNWIPNVSPLKYVYDGSVQIPKAQVDTGIDGETLTIEIECDRNRYANEDDVSGYLAVAKLDESIKNYTLSNASIRYFIKRANAVLSVSSNYSVSYTGENQLPPYNFIGDSEALKITINGVEITNGVKDPGVYELKFSSKKSQNYLATDEVICLFTIKAISISNTSNDGSVVVNLTNSNGVDIAELSVKVIPNFDASVINSIEDIENYYFYKAITVGVANEQFSEDSQISFKINNNTRNVRIFKATSNGLKELQVEMKEGVAIVCGDQGDYVLLIERQNWWTTLGGITTILLIAFTVIVGGLVVIMALRPKKFEIEKQVNIELEKVIKHKANNGEQLTSEDIKRIRKQIRDNISKNNKKDD